MQVFVLGMHRSGTSAVSRLINMMGASLGPAHLIGEPAFDNEKGFWERTDVSKLNDQLLQLCDCTWDEVSNYKQALLPKELPAELREQLQRIIFQLDTLRPWVLKDPRLCLTFPMWRSQLEVPVCVLPYRSPHAIAQSLQFRNGFGLLHGLALWEQYTLAALHATKDLPRLIVCYEKLILDPVGVVSELYEGLCAADLVGLRKPSAREITAFVETRLQHQQGLLAASEGLLNFSQRHLAAALEDGTALEWDTVPPLSAGASEVLGDVRRRLNHESEFRITLDGVRAELATTQGLLANIQEEAAVLKEDLERERAMAAELTQTLNGGQAELANTQGMLARSQQEAATLRRELERERATVSELKINLVGLRAELDHTQGQWSNTVDDAATLKAELERERATATTRANELNEFQARHAEQVGHLNALEGQLAALNEELTSTKEKLLERETRLWDAAGQIAIQSRWLIDIDQAFTATLASWRWRVGHHAVRGVERLLLRPKPFLAVDHLGQILRQFKEWRRSQPEDTNYLVADTNCGVRTTASRSAAGQPVQATTAAHQHSTNNNPNSAQSGTGSLVGMPDLATFHLLGYEVLCLPVIEWGFRFQRPQQMARQFVQGGHQVYYVSLTFATRPEIHEIEPGVIGVTVPGRSQANVYKDLPKVAEVEAQVAALVEQLNSADRTLWVCMVQLPYWVDVAEALRQRTGCILVYDCMDDHHGFSTNQPLMLAAESQLLATADLVVVSSQVLMEKVASHARKAILVRNGVDYHHFAAVAAIRHPPVAQLTVGYYGAIADWFDSELVGILATLRPTWRFVLIGDTFSADLVPIAQPNIELAGEQPYSQLPHLIRDWDCCIIPFKRVPLTEATNPVKVYEMLAAGKPVVAVTLPELVPLSDLNLITLADTAEAFAAAIEHEVTNDSLARQESRRTFALANTWEVRYRDLEAEVRKLFPLVSIMVVTYNNLDLNRLCIESVLGDTDYPNIELIVVDNASSDGTPELLRGFASRDSRMTLIRNPDNKGYAVANNQALAIASGEYLCLLNNDTVVSGAWLSTLVQHLRRDPQLGLIGPVTNAIGNEAQIPVGYDLLIDMPDWSAKHCRQYRGEIVEIGMLAFFCVVMTRGVFQAVGPLDERFGIGMFEDDDYNQRVRAAGYKVRLALDSFVHHWQRASFKLLGEDEYLRIYHENKEMFHEKQSLTSSRQLALEGLRQRCETASTVFLFPPSIGWNVHLFQRPHHLARALAQGGEIVIFDCSGSTVDEIDLLREVEPGLFLFQGDPLLLRDIPKLILWTFTYNYGYRDYFSNGVRVIYDWIDDLAVFPYDQQWLKALHQRAVKEADLIVAVARTLHGELVGIRPDAIYLPNAVDSVHFNPPPEPNNASKDQAFSRILSSGRPIAGYYGALAKWFDYQLLKQVASLRKDWEFVLIGPDLDGSLRPSGITEQANVHWLGPRDYADLPSYLFSFDVAMIPFRINEITLATSPLKLFEYFAGGRGVVTTPMPECAAFSEVLIGRSAEDFSQGLDHARLLTGGREYLDRLAPIISDNTWARRIHQVMEKLNACIL